MGLLFLIQYGIKAVSRNLSYMHALTRHESHMDEMRVLRDSCGGGRSLSTAQY